ncbi:hypothetical protein TruAng_012247 [Truncatella angustata]|nr:hypothetical protein TruAng_012247 [Truncatella angustata]
MSFRMAVVAFPVRTCATVAPVQSTLDVATSALTVDHHPFGIAYYTNDIAFVIIRRSVAVLNVSEFTPVLKHQIIPSPDVLAHLGLSDSDPDEDTYIFHGLVLSPDRKNVYAAGGHGALILDTERAVAGRNDSVVGVLANNGVAGNYSAMAAITPDSRYVFLTQEFGSPVNGKRGDLEVWEVNTDTNAVVTGVYKGYITLGYATVDMAFSSDNTKLYVTSEATGIDDVDGLRGSISVLDVETLKTNPSGALLWTVDAGCHPVRIKLGSDGKRVWINTREANTLLVFDADKLNSNETAGEALITDVVVGTSPVSLAIVGDYVLTADSNRWGYSNTSTGLTVVDTLSVQKGIVANFPQIRTGQFPREFGLSPDGNTLLVSEFDGYAVRAVNVSSLKETSKLRRGIVRHEL